jgi:serine/threonine-protein kinase
MTTTAKARRGLSLGARIFLTSALLIVLAVGAAIAVTYLRGEQIAERAVERSLAASFSAQNDLLAGSQQRLELMGQTLAKDPPLVAYLVEALGGGLSGESTIDVPSIVDQLQRRRQNFPFDFALVVDIDGIAVAHTERPTAAGEDYFSHPIVQRALEEFVSGTDYWLEQGELYQVAAVPLIQRLDSWGALILGIRVSSDLAWQIKRITGSDVSFLVRSGEELTIPVSTLAASMRDQLLRVFRDDAELTRRVLDEAEPLPDHEFQLTGHQRGCIAPLKGKDGKVVAATIGLVSLDELLAPYRQIQFEVLLGGLAALLVALLLSFTLSRRTLAPIRRLEAAASAAAQGNYDAEIEVRRHDEVGRLGTAFRSLLKDLREKREVESFVGDLSRHLPESPQAQPLRQAVTKNLALLAFEFRSLAHPRVVKEPADSISRLDLRLRTLATVASSHGGRVELAHGLRTVLSFEGPDAATRALAAAIEARRSLHQLQGMIDDSEGPVLALTRGDVVRGSVQAGERPSAALLGLPVQQLDALLREALPGDLILSREVYADLADRFREAQIELRQGRGLLNPQPFYLVPPADAERLVLPMAKTSLLEPALPDAAVVTLAGIGPGTVLDDRFEILSVLGAGGMGVVFKARDRELDDLVALKTLKKAVWEDRDQLERLKSELKLARRITHPNVLRTFDFGEVNGIPYISMEYVRGMTVRYLLEQTGRLPPAAALRLARQLCAGLGAAHGVGVLHRDIKPENLILDNAGNLKLMDFGIARPIDRATPGTTQPGMVVGTPRYLAPEQLRGQAVDGRADIYACGVVFYEMFTGGLPFEDSNPLAMISAHLREPPRPPSLVWPEIPAELEQLILRCLAKEPAERFASAEDLLRGLDSLRG